jgi:hypothetical protein
MKHLFSCLESHITCQTDRIVQEIRKLRKEMVSSNNAKERQIQKNIAPIEYNGVNLCDVQPSGSVSQVALAVARQLFSDEKLASTQLAKKTAKGRPPASPKRTSVFRSKS